ncbi:uncharacterized protein SPSK_02810 [Sporothrix schenckii 1099-18]|uniref:Secreted protein n=1 Tax=Sporothrix schenckii 1099-18 TaxID=1397361 RepID=A0A0F2MCI4_SPOSC|nr:uncharacterized protein SPSK_02810 [Sporothrix schenckii 1099-18]KJR86789.1 hypothetical protein SPSK_02810 [Sporothrix schenckii 1099-18]
MSVLSVAALRILPHHLFAFPQPVSVDDTSDWPATSRQADKDVQGTGRRTAACGSKRALWPGATWSLGSHCNSSVDLLVFEWETRDWRTGGSRSKSMHTYGILGCLLLSDVGRGAARSMLLTSFVPRPPPVFSRRKSFLHIASDSGPRIVRIREWPD